MMIFKESIIVLFFIRSKNKFQKSILSRWEFPEEQRPSPRSGILSSKCRIFSVLRLQRFLTLKIRWRDGFSIDGGELRHYSDPGSREFMVRIKIAIEELQSVLSFSGFSDERIHPGGAGERSKRGGGACGHGGPQVGIKTLLDCFNQ